MNKRPKLSRPRYSTQGYLPDSPDRFNPVNVIPGGDITMNTVPFDIYAIPDVGAPRVMPANSGYHNFPGASQVTEVPLDAYQKGGMLDFSDQQLAQMKFAAKMGLDLASYLRLSPEPISNGIGWAATAGSTAWDLADSKDMGEASAALLGVLPFAKTAGLSKKVVKGVRAYNTYVGSAKGVDVLGNIKEGFSAFGDKLPSFKHGGQWSFDEDELPSMQSGGGTESNLSPEMQQKMQDMAQKANLTDFLYTEDDLNYLNSATNGEYDKKGDLMKFYCPKGECLEVAFDAYDMRVGNKYSSELFPSSSRIKDSLQMQSYSKEKYQQLSPAEKEKVKKWASQFPYMDTSIEGEENFTVDSWDIHGQLLEHRGTSLFQDRSSDGAEIPSKFNNMTPEERKELYEQIPVGSIIGFGDDHHRKNTLNERHGLARSRHSAMVIGYAPDGVPVIYDYTKHTRLDDPSFGFGISNITYPEQVRGKTRKWLEENGMLNQERSDLKMDISQLGGDRGELDPFVNTLSKRKNELMNDLNLSNSDYDRYAKLVTAISMQETKGGKDFYHNVQAVTKNGYGDSHGITQLTLENILSDKNPHLKKLALKYGITSESDLYDPEKAAIASMIYAKSNQAMADKFYKKGRSEDGSAPKPGLRTFINKTSIRDFLPGQTPGAFGDGTFRDGEAPGFLGDDGFYVDEINARVPVEGWFGRDLSPKEVQKKLDKAAPGVYTVGQTEDGELSIRKITKGNEELDRDARFIYSWQSPGTLATGDAGGKSQYYKKVSEFMKKIR